MISKHRDLVFVFQASVSRLNLILALKGKKAIDNNAGEDDIKSPPLMLVTTPLTPTLETLNTENFQTPTMKPPTPSMPSEINLDNKTSEAEPVQEPVVPEATNITEPNPILESAQGPPGIPPSNQEILPPVNQVIQPDKEIVSPNGPIQPDPDPDVANDEVTPPASVMNPVPQVQPPNPELIPTQ